MSDERGRGQFGEDRILAEVFAGRTHGYCVEVGAYDGLTGSATYPFEQRGWSCLLVEPIPALAEQARRNRTSPVVNCAASSRAGEATLFVARDFEQMSTMALTADHRAWVEAVGGTLEPITVPTATLDSMLEAAGFPEVQFMTIDVEGHELAVLEGLTLERYAPRIIIVEDNSPGGNRETAAHLARHGYVHFRRTGVNEWYAQESDAELVRPEELARFRRTVARERIRRQLGHQANRAAARTGRYLPAPLKGRLRRLLDFLRPR
jgi:FkbM family methyltransferase